MQVLNSNRGGFNCLVSKCTCADAGHVRKWNGAKCLSKFNLTSTEAKACLAQPSHIRVGFPGFKPIDQLSVLLFLNIRPSNLHNCSNKFVVDDTSSTVN